MTHEGGCFCGKLRYRAEGRPLRVMHCHCTICQRVTGAPVVTWITFPTKGLSWPKGEPARLKSTASATRYFCAGCGTHLVFVIDGAEELDVTVASLDHPEAAKPEHHIFVTTRVPWLQLSDGLPEYVDWGPDL
ncbi:MAG: GFA family protein [Alphaproteobacteria bacterium]